MKSRSTVWNGRERVLAHVEGRPVDRPALMPITMMFAADQIGVKYHDYATDYRVLVEAQIRTAERFEFDHVSAISDPAREAADFGAAVQFFPDQPPAIDENNALLADSTALVRLRLPDPLGGGRMHDRIKAVARLQERAGRDKYVEGWVEGPCAEGADLRGINMLMLDFTDDPAFVRDLFALAVENAIQFAQAQIEAGADLIGVGDAAASLVGPAIYEEFVWPQEKRLVDSLHALGARVRLHICGNTRAILAGMGRLGCDIVDLDSMVPLSEARAMMGPQPLLLGNLDPVRVLRNGTPDMIRAAVADCHRQGGSRYIIGAGCEVPRDTPPDNTRALLEYAKAAR
jgi:MtaA/CmuA family methyltransferase